MNINKYLSKLNRLDDKKIIITGANSGIGFECAKHVLGLGAHLVMAARNIERAEKAKLELLELYPNSNVEIILYDQSSFNGVDKLISTIINKHNDFYALFLNAGMFHPNEKILTEDGFPITIATNYISNYYLLNKFQYFLNNVTSNKKIIIQGSLTSRMKFKKVHLLTTNQASFNEYCLSKYALLNAFNYFKNNNKNELVKYIYCEPGITNSNITRGFPKGFQSIARVFLKTFMMSTKKASLTALSSISEDYESGNLILPRGLLRIAGYPKKYKLKKKYISDKYLLEADEVIKR